MNYEDVLDFLNKWEYELHNYDIIVKTTLFLFRINNRFMFEIYDKKLHIHMDETIEIHTDEITILGIQEKKQ